MLGLNMAKEQSTIGSKQSESVPFWTSYRLRLVILCSVGLMLASTYRADLSLAMVCMANDEDESNVANSIINSTHHFMETTAVYERNRTNNETTGVIDSSTDVCPILTKKNLEGVEFQWSKRHQALMLGSFFWGCPVFQVPGGWMAWRFGAKRIVTIGMFAEAVLNFVTPWCARASEYLVMVNRALSGMAHSLLYPASLYLVTTWSTLEERGRLTSVAFAGTTIGTALTFPVSGLLCDYGVDGGWPSIFYLLGSLGVMWVVIWMWYAHDSPDDAPRLDPAEKSYLQKDELAFKINNTTKTPWISILLSRAAWACMLCIVAVDYGIFMMLTQLPTYMNEVLRFEIMSNGLFLTLPYVGMSIFINIGGVVADQLVEKTRLSKAWTRRIIAFIGYIVPVILLVVMGTWDCTQQTAAVVTLIALVSVTGLQLPCLLINFSEIGGQFSGVVFGMASVLSNLAGITAPYLVAVITPHKTQKEWMNAFILAACVYVVGALIFCTMAKFELEPWAVNDDNVPAPESHTNTHGKRRESIFSNIM